MTATTANQEKAVEILKSMEGDVSLVPERLSEWWSNYLTYHHDRYLGTLDFLESVKSRVLEIGSVPCQFTSLLQQLGYEVRGMDLAPERVEAFIRKHELSVNKVDIETDPFPFEDGSFGTVIFLEVLEHLRINPLHTFRELARVLEPGGRLLLSTPNITPAHRLMFFFDKPYQGDLVAEFRKLETVGHMGHFRLYSLVDIRAMLDEVGLEVVATSFEGEYATPTWKTKWMRILSPRKDIFRTYTYVQARKRS